jgi:hypothetical protein
MADFQDNPDAVVPDFDDEEQQKRTSNADGLHGSSSAKYLPLFHFADQEPGITLV